MNSDGSISLNTLEFDLNTPVVEFFYGEYHKPYYNFFVGSFKHGFEDASKGLGFHKDYDNWTVPKMREYELGRLYFYGRENV